MRHSQPDSDRSRRCRTANRGKRRTDGGRGLRFERLEDRRLLANLILDIELWTVADGAGDAAVKGQRIPYQMENGTKVYQVQRDDAFLVQVLVEDQSAETETGRDSAGVVALPLDLHWNTDFCANGALPESDAAGLIRYADPAPPLFPDAIPRADSLVTFEFNAHRFVNGFSLHCGADDLRGGTIPASDETSPIGIQGCNPDGGDDSCREFSLLRFEAINVGDTNFQAELDGSMSFADAAPLDNDPTAEVVIRVRAPDVGTASLSGFVYADADKDGVRDVDADGEPAEAGLPEVEIELYLDGEFLRSDHTGPDGWYHFEDLPPGTYEIRQRAQPECFLDGTETLGTILPAGEARGTAGNDGFTGIELRAGEAGIDYNFGELGLKAACVNKAMFLGSADLQQATVHDPLGVPSVDVRGTDQDDTINVTIDAAAIRVTVNDGAPQTFPLTAGQTVSIDGLEGRDTVIVTGSAGDDSAHFQGAQFTYRNAVCVAEPDTGTRCDWDWAVKAVGVEAVNVDAAAGRDLAVVRDSAGADTLNAAGNQATIGLSDRDLDLLAFERVRAISTRGGDDQAEAIESREFELELLGDWSRP